MCNFPKISIEQQQKSTRIPINQTFQLTTINQKNFSNKASLNYNKIENSKYIIRKSYNKFCMERRN